MSHSAFADCDRISKDKYTEFLNKDPFVQLLNGSETTKKKESNRVTAFDPLLQQNGFLELPPDFTPCQLDLDADMHPIFRLENWDDTFPETQKAHAKMTPALLLGTVWITKDEFLDWFIHVFSADSIIQDSVTNKFVLSRVGNLSATQRTEARQKVKERLNLMAQEMKFYWLPKSKGEAEPPVAACNINQWHAMANLRGSHVPKAKYSVLGPRIGLHTQKLYHLLSADGVCSISHSKNLRFQLKLAIDLVHEIAHAFYAYKAGDDFKMFRGGRKDPYVFATDPMPEIGHTWEYSVFGMLMTACHNGPGDIGPMFARPYDFAFSSMTMGQVVPMTMVESMFHKDTWENPVVPICNVLGQEKNPCVWVKRFTDNRYHDALYRDGKRLAIYPDLIFEDDGRDTVNLPAGTTFVDWFKRISSEDRAAALKRKHKARSFLGPRGEYEKCMYDGKGPRQN